MLVRYIRRVRRADPAVRTRHAFFWATGITGITAILWAMSLPAMVRPLSEHVVSDETVRPWSSFLERAREQVAAVMGTQLESGQIPTEEIDSVAAQSSAATGAPLQLELTPETLAAVRARGGVPTSTEASTVSSGDTGIPHSVQISPATGTATSARQAVRLITTPASTTASSSL